VNSRRRALAPEPLYPRRHGGEYPRTTTRKRSGACRRCSSRCKERQERLQGFPLNHDQGPLTEFERRRGNPSTRGCELQQNQSWESIPSRPTSGVRMGVCLGENPTRATQGQGDGTERVARHRCSAVPFFRLWMGRHARLLRRGAIVRGEASTRHHLGYDSVHDAGDEDTLCQIENSKDKGDIMARMKFICDAERCTNAMAGGMLQAGERVAWGVNLRRWSPSTTGVPGRNRSRSPACIARRAVMAVCR